jgi:excisionase family DNA binding protein
LSEDLGRVTPSSALRRRSLADGENTALIRRLRMVTGGSLPEPKVVDDDARWHHWFSPEGVLRTNVAEDRDNVLLIKGPRGVGKSTLSLRIGRSLYHEINASNLKEHVGFSVPQFTDLILQSRDTYVWLDEAAVGGDAADWHTPEAKSLKETVNTMRWRHNTVALLIPNADDFLKAIRVRQVEFHINCTHRPKGRAVVRTKNWDLERPLKTGDLGLRTDWQYNPIRWDPFEPEDPLWLEYTRLKQEADDRRARRQSALLHAEETYTMGRVAKIAGVPDRTLRSWVENGSVAALTLPGGQHRLTESQLQQFLERIGTRATTEPAGPVKAADKRKTGRGVRG